MRLPVHIWIREENARPEEVAGYFMELARHLDAKPRRMRLVIESTVPLSLDFSPADGQPTVTVGGETAAFNVRRRWIPDHPVPLALGPAPSRRMKRTTLLIDPVDGNRFRVRDRRTIPVPGWTYALAAAAGVAAAITLHPVAIGATIALAALILSLQCLDKWPFTSAFPFSAFSAFTFMI